VQIVEKQQNNNKKLDTVSRMNCSGGKKKERGGREREREKITGKRLSDENCLKQQVN
jgi:hypothetical protein